VPWPDGIPMPAQTVMFVQIVNDKGQETNYLLPENVNQIKINERIVIIPMKYDRDLFDELTFRFPQGKIEKKDNISYFIIE